MVQGNCDILATDQAGCIPAHFAAKKDHLDCLRFLVKNGTELMTKDGSGKTPAHMVRLMECLQAIKYRVLKTGLCLNAVS